MRTLHVVSHTHWDREWYLPFQQFRFGLVRLIDCLLDMMRSDPDYRFFMLDGQTIVLDDYLEIRPEREQLIRQLVQEGRLLIGPWYILPDEFLEGPEALVRNLIFGYRACRRFTSDPQPIEGIGYLPDPFGHLSQLPQIAAGFGLKALCFWRGVGDAPTEFLWAAPDGTECLVLHLRTSYGNAARLSDDEPGFIQDLAAARDALVPHAATSHLLMMQGTDHMEPRADLPRLLQAAGQAHGDRVIHSTIPNYLVAVERELGTEALAALPRIQGELRSPQFAHLLPAVLSARLWIKQWNHQCETLLVRWAEPTAALCEILTGDGSHRAFLRKSWDWLLQNHPHDSICGCSVDQVHREMKTRFAWSEQIAEEVTRSGLEELASRIDTTHHGQYEEEPNAGLVVFNPLPASRTGRVRCQVNSPPGDDWTLAQLDGQPVPYQVLEQVTKEHFNELMDRQALLDWLAEIAAGRGPNMGRFRVDDLETSIDGSKATLLVWITEVFTAQDKPPVEPHHLAKLQSLLAHEEIEGFRVRVVERAGIRLECLARDVPACGYTQLRLLRTGAAIDRMPVSPASPQDAIENEFFHVEVGSVDGTLKLTDKRTGFVLSGLNRFVDGGDRGDEYTYCPPEYDTVIDAPASPPTIRVLEDRLGSTLKVSLSYQIPSALVLGDRARRDNWRVAMPITSRITLTPGVPRVDVETIVDNPADDHRLRVHFPTALVTGSTWAESHFDVIERPITLPKDTAGWAEQPSGTHPQAAFVDLTDGLHGLMIANRGLPEFEAIPSDRGAGVTLALTLLRSVGWLSRGDLHNRQGHAGPLLPTPEAQCRGSRRFHYAIIPHTGNYLSAMQHAHAFTAPLRAVSVRAHPGDLPPRGSLVQVSPAAVVLSALKPPEDGAGAIILRVYNSAATPVQARIEFWRAFQEVALVPLHERGIVRVLNHDSGAISLPLRSREIATLRVQF